MPDIEALLGHYHTVHTNNNAALVVAALLLGGWELLRGSSVWGAMHGAKNLPSKWIDPLHDTLNSQIIGYHPIAISECARRSVQIAKNVLNTP